MEATKTETRGGARPGAGRKQLAETTTIAFRIPVDLLNELKESCKGTLNKEFIHWAKRKAARRKKS